MGEVTGVRVRFAPSPTGYLHIGGARTALFNWLFARHHNGVFILRIEDTDIKRSEDKYLKEILDSLKWLGLDWDEGPYFQSKRFDLYKEYAERLIKQGDAYLTSEEGKEGKTQAVRFKISREIVYIDDLIHGRIQFDNSLIEDDLVIMKSDGSPTYNFACVIDDATLGITHVIRGDDHISNTPKQIPLYKALGFDTPEFAHIPLILGEDRSRLSKRHGAASITSYLEEGYLPEALVNYLALLGWSPGGDREIMDIEVLKKEFSLSRVNKTGAAFNEEKLDWINKQYIKRYDENSLADLIMPLLKEKGCLKDSPLASRQEKGWVTEIVRLYQPRIKTLSDFLTQTEFFFSDEVRYDISAKEKFFAKDGLGDIFERLIQGLERLEGFGIKDIEISIRTLADELKIGLGDIVHPVRVALTGKSVSAGLFEIMALLGKDRVRLRLKSALDIIAGESSSGRTHDSGSCRPGSNPGSPAMN